MSVKKNTSLKRDIPRTVLTSALHLFTIQGYFNTSIPDIVKHSGCSIGSIYHHFSDKQGIAKALYDSLVERMESALIEIDHRCTSTKQRCYEIIKLLFELTENEPEVMRFILFSKHREISNDVAPICSTQPFILMRNFVANGMKTGEVRNLDQTVAVSVVFGGALRLIQLRLDNVLKESVQDKLDEIFTCSWRAVALD